MFDFLFQSLKPFKNPIGFGLSDFIEFGLAAFLVTLVLLRPWIGLAADWLAARPSLSMAIVAMLPVLLRLALLANHPAPEPRLPEEFSHALAADTFAHWRLANPPHPMNRFFETSGVLQEPRYASAQPPGQGIAMAFGKAAFGHVWAGLLAASAVFAASCYWMLRAWLPPVWALGGGLLAALHFGPTHSWTNSYLGGGIAAAAGCMVFGGLMRMRGGDPWRLAPTIVAIGLGLHLLTRPEETVVLALAACVLIPRCSPRQVAEAAGVFLVFAVLSVSYSSQVTGVRMLRPEVLSRQQYGVPAASMFEKPVAPQRALTPRQAQAYAAQAALRQNSGYWKRLGGGVRYFGVLLAPPLYVGLLWFLVSQREKRFLLVTCAFGVLVLGMNCFPAFSANSLAPAAGLMAVMAIEGVRRLGRAGSIALGSAFAYSFFWYGVQVSQGSAAPSRRATAIARLAEESGTHLVLVRYPAGYPLRDEWIFNDAEIGEARVVWARDLGPDETAKLAAYYPARKVWVLEPQYTPRRLDPYVPPPAPPEPAEPAKPAAPEPVRKKWKLQFEEVK